MKKIVVVLSIIAMAVAADTKIGGTTYFDYTSGDETSAFNFKRQYISFSGQASDDIKYKFVVDVGATNKLSGEDTRLTAFLKKAQIDYKTSFAKISMGVIGTNTYGVQEKNWGYRFMEKAPIDLWGFSSTADIGIGFSKSLTDDLNVSLQMVNGEGYKSPQSDKYHKISLNATYGEPKLHKNNGFNTGLVYTTESTDSDPITMMSVFGGYASSCPIFASNSFRIGSEYDMMTDSEGKNKTLISLSTNYRIMENWNIFLRYDIHDPDVDNENDGDSYLIAGILLNCGNGLFIAPNVKISTPEEGDATTINMIKFQYKF